MWLSSCSPSTAVCSGTQTFSDELHRSDLIESPVLCPAKSATTSTSFYSRPPSPLQHLYRVYSCILHTILHYQFNLSTRSISLTTQYSVRYSDRGVLARTPIPLTILPIVSTWTNANAIRTQNKRIHTLVLGDGR